MHLKGKFFLREEKIVYYLKYVKDNIIYFFSLILVFMDTHLLTKLLSLCKRRKNGESEYDAFSIKHCPMIYSKLFEYFLQYIFFFFWSDTFWFSEHDVLHLEYVRLLKTCEKGTWSEYNFMFKGVDLVGESTSVRICKRNIEWVNQHGKEKKDIF